VLNWHSVGADRLIGFCGRTTFVARKRGIFRDVIRQDRGPVKSPAEKEKDALPGGRRRGRNRQTATTIEKL
jgi:hypothetical protein